MRVLNLHSSFNIFSALGYKLNIKLHSKPRECPTVTIDKFIGFNIISSNVILTIGQLQCFCMFLYVIQ